MHVLYDSTAYIMYCFILGYFDLKLTEIFMRATLNSRKSSICLLLVQNKKYGMCTTVPNRINKRFPEANGEYMSHVQKLVIYCLYEGS